MSENCPHCGKFREGKLHGACKDCLGNPDHLPPGIRKMYNSVDKYSGKEKKSIKGIVRSYLTLKLDGLQFAEKWNPKSNLQKVLDTSDERDYLSVEAEIEILELVEKED